ncbi:TMEM175 family protein [Solicola sp. PLA-1-18]|uniref:TMEM175 family protein n=1 Tax=Solicola sp. PLA-1-18 TaxID=3380532 RepID=UPI003B7A6E4F
MPAPQSSERLVFFTDAVVAIAITLLVLPLVDAVPEAADTGTGPLDLVAEQSTQIYSFLLSFVVIARLWLVHHRLFADVTAVTGSLLWWNMAWLLTIVVLPFPTELVGSYDGRAVPLIYIGTVLASAVCQSALALIIRRHRLDGSASGRPVGGSVRSTAAIAAAFVLTLLVPAVGFWSLLLLVAEPWVTRLARRRA